MGGVITFQSVSESKRFDHLCYTVSLVRELLRSYPPACHMGILKIFIMRPSFEKQDLDI
jgi:hypothetical protein